MEVTKPPFPIRPFTEAEWPQVNQLLNLAFLDEPRQEDADVFLQALELDRTLVAFDGDQPVGSAGAFTFELTAPGAVVPAAGVTIVVVHPTYRRRGLLSALMDRQLGDLAESGEAVAVLWASEATIYGRYGYAVASQRATLDIGRAEAGLVADAPDGRELNLQLAQPQDVRQELAQVYAAMTPTRPGYIARNETQWADTLHDPEHGRNGALATQALLVRDGDDLRGYALYRVKPSDDGLVSTSTVHVSELQAMDAAAYAACWRFLSSIDLTARITAGKLPVDAPLFHLLADSRRARVGRADGLWARLVRLGDAMAQRRYAAPVDLVLDVVDDRCPWNTGSWRLSGDENGASCERTTNSPDVRVDTRALASAYLGDSTLTAYLTTGRAEEHTPGALRRLSTAMSWDPRPWGPHSF